MNIPRYQRVFFLVLFTLSALMAAFLVRVHRRNVQRLSELTSTASSPIEAPSTTEAEPITFLFANDNDGTIQSSDRQVALPSEATIRLRAILERLFTEYSLPDSKHPLNPGGPAIADVFFVPLPLNNPASYAGPASSAPVAPRNPGTDLSRLNGHLAVVNLHQTFADTHPSGVQVETLTILSMIGTIHANFPQVTQIRFLVEGRSKDTLAGHVALDRLYPSTDTTIQATQ